MSEVLRDARLFPTDELPFAIELDLRIEDRDVIAALSNYAEGPARDEYALEALKISSRKTTWASGSFPAVTRRTSSRSSPWIEIGPNSSSGVVNLVRSQEK